MSRTSCVLLQALACVVCVAEGVHAQAGIGERADTFEVRGGSVSFDVATNVRAISVTGKSTELKASARVLQRGDGLAVEELQATVPVRSLSTGLGLRDDHMRRYIFSTDGGETPDVQFVARETACAAVLEGRFTCAVAGDLVIRGTSRPFALALEVRNQKDAYRVVGEGTVKLSTYEIAQPSQFGVRTADDIRLRLDLVAEPAGRHTLARGARQ